MESPLEVLSRVAFMVNKTMPPPGDYAKPHKYGSQLGRFTCWRAKDLAELRRAELSDAKRSKVGASRPSGVRGNSFAAVTSAPDRLRREEDVVVGSGSKLVQREQRDVASRDQRRTEETPLQRSLCEDLDRLSGRAREAILRCVDPTRASPDCLGTNDFGLIFLPRSPSVAAAACSGGCNDIQPLAADDDDVEPLNLSVRRRDSTSPVRQSSPSAIVGTTRHAGASSAADPEVEEHFRRSLGQRYPKGERARNGEVGSRSHIAASVEEHFLKSLGSAWFNAGDGEACATADVDHGASDTTTAASALLVSSDGPAPAPVNCYSHGVGTAACFPAGASGLRQAATVDGRKRSRIATADRATSLDCRRQSTAADRGLHMVPRGAASPAAEVKDCGKDEDEHCSPAAKRPCKKEEPSIALSSRRCRDGEEAAGLDAAPTTPAAVSPTPVSPAAATSPALASPAAAIGIVCDAKSCEDELPLPVQRQWPLTPATLPDSTTVGGGDDCADPRPPSVGGHSGQAAERSLSPPGRASSVAASATPSAAADAASVDEHFAKALGSKWAEIKMHLSAPPPATVRCERL